jgi:four helix bundle protein
MFLKLNHQNLDIYTEALELVAACYALTNLFPAEERFRMSNQMRKAALSVHLNICEGASRKSSVERKRYYEISRGSIVEIDAAMDVADKLDYLKNIDITKLGYHIIKCFKILMGMIKGCVQ